MKLKWNITAVPDGLLISAVLLSIVFLLSALSSNAPASDGLVRYQTFLTLFSDDVVYSKFSTVQPYLTKLLDSATRLIMPNIPIDFFPRYFGFLLLIVFFLLSLTIFRDRRIFLIYAAMLPMSMITHYLGQFFSETISSTLLSIGFVIFLAGKRLGFAILGGFIAALGLANWFVLIAPSFIIFITAVFFYFYSKERDTRFLVFLLTSIILGAGMYIIDLAVKDQLFNNPYGTDGEVGYRSALPYSGLPGFSHPVIIGILGSTLSFGKSIFLFNPFLVFLFIRQYLYKRYILIFTIVTFLIYSKWWAWYGGFSFGTRFYIFTIIPSIFVFLSSLKDNTRNYKNLEFFCFILAIWIAICGKYFGLQDTAHICTQNNYAYEAFCWYVPEFSPLINPFITHGIDGILDQIIWHDYFYIFSMIALYTHLRTKKTNVTGASRFI